MPRDPRQYPMDDRIRAVHMLDAARDALAFCDGRTRGDMNEDSQLRRAVIHCLLEIGEAASRMSDPGRSRLPGVPWGQIVGMRHRLVHVYWVINLDIVWAVVTDELPALVAALEGALAQWPAPNRPPP